MYFSGAARQGGAIAGVVFVSDKKHILPYSFVLIQLRSNNTVEHQALHLGLQMAIKMGIRDLNIYGDSQLVINKLIEKYEVKKKDLISYHKHVLQLLDKLDRVKLEHVSSSVNKMSGALTSLTVTLALGIEEDITIPLCSQWVVLPNDEDLKEDITRSMILR